MLRDRARRQAEAVGEPGRGQRPAQLAQDRCPAPAEHQTEPVGGLRRGRGRSRRAPAPRAWKPTARTSGSSVE